MGVLRIKRVGEWRTESGNRSEFDLSRLTARNGNSAAPKAAGGRQAGEWRQKVAASSQVEAAAWRSGCKAETRKEALIDAPVG